MFCYSYGMEGFSNIKAESVEKEPVFEYTFFRDHDEVFQTLAHNRAEAFEAFKARFGKEFDPEDGDGFTRIAQ